MPRNQAMAVERAPVRRRYAGGCAQGNFRQDEQQGEVTRERLQDVKLSAKQAFANEMTNPEPVPQQHAHAPACGQ